MRERMVILDGLERFVSVRRIFIFSCCSFLLIMYLDFLNENWGFELRLVKFIKIMFKNLFKIN